VDAVGGNGLVLNFNAFWLSCASRSHQNKCKIARIDCVGSNVCVEVASRADHVYT
jgi:hypothetical protein